MCEANLRKWFALADHTDIEESAQAYPRYNALMREMAEKFNTSHERATAVFVSLSPNNDYVSNLRSAVTVLDAIKNEYPPDRVVVSTYNHCRDRAFAYGTGRRDFLAETKGPKVTSFYRNILDPKDWRFVTVDGHISAAWQGADGMNMKDAIIRRRLYYEIRDIIIKLAFEQFMYPNAYQAAIWFTRKRVLGIRYSSQPDLLYDRADRWKVSMDLAGIKPYPLR